MNWYKISQADINSQYQKMLDEAASSITITGSGSNQTIQIPGTSTTIVVRDILETVKRQILPILQEKHVKEINTDPISNQQAQGMAQSHRPGVIQVDVNKIVNSAKGAMPPNIQTDGITVDTDMIGTIVQRVKNYIQSEILETAAHESQHVSDYSQAFQNQQPFTSVTEAPAEQFGQQIRQRYSV
jgi:hypothetical protein